MNYRTTWENYLQQLRAGEEAMRKFEERLREEGYVNTIHDCWEKVKEGPR